MAEWQHKVRKYKNPEEFSTDQYPTKKIDNRGYVPVNSRRRSISVEEWLDIQCKGGWELFLFNEHGVFIFRRLV
jgi:hypothetical protein